MQTLDSNLDLIPQQQLSTKNKIAFATEQVQCGGGGTTMLIGGGQLQRIQQLQNQSRTMCGA